jgi:Flp pilus assembly protein TadB
VIAALVAVSTIAVGLPLLAWWIGGRRFWSRLRGRADSDPWGDFVRRHRLSVAEAARIAAEVSRGRQLEDPRLRRAAVDWATRLLEQETLRAPRNARTRRLLLALLTCWASAVFAWLLYRVLTGRPEDVNWVSLVLWTAAAVWIVRRRRRLRRSIVLNAEPSTAGDA